MRPKLMLIPLLALAGCGGPRVYTINQAPFAVVTAENHGPYLEWDASQSYDPDGEIVDYQWHLDAVPCFDPFIFVSDDHTRVVALLPTNCSGLWALSVTITDDAGATNQAGAGLGT